MWFVAETERRDEAAKNAKKKIKTRMPQYSNGVTRIIIPSYVPIIIFLNNSNRL